MQRNAGPSLNDSGTAQAWQLTQRSVGTPSFLLQVFGRKKEAKKKPSNTLYKIHLEPHQKANEVTATQHTLLTQRRRVVLGWTRVSCVRVPYPAQRRPISSQKKTYTNMDSGKTDTILKFDPGPNNSSRSRCWAEHISMK